MAWNFPINEIHEHYNVTGWNHHQIYILNTACSSEPHKCTHIVTITFFELNLFSSVCISPTVPHVLMFLMITHSLLFRLIAMSLYRWLLRCEFRSEKKWLGSCCGSIQDLLIDLSHWESNTLFWHGLQRHFYGKYSMVLIGW